MLNRSIPPISIAADQARLAALDGAAIVDTPVEEVFDDIVRLAATVCGAPVALVGLIARDRQWFKARIGFPLCEIDLDTSICIHILSEPDLLVISDLTCDARTMANLLVTKGPRMRFYAGAPLRTMDGHVIGSLCVLDFEPRPNGLSDAQATNLRALARQAMGQIDSRRLLKERDVLLAEQRAIEASLRDQGKVLQTITDHVGQAVFQLDDRGLIMFANPAAETIFGWSRREMMGKSLHDLIHHSHTDGRPYPSHDCLLLQALVHGKLLSDIEDTFFHKDGRPVEVLVTNAPVHVGDKITSIVMTAGDITRRKTAERQLVESEAYWRGLFERLREGMVVGRVVRDPGGKVIDWRFLDVNDAWGNLTGLSAERALTGTLRELLPSVAAEWIEEPARVVDSGQSMQFTREARQLGRWYEGRISPLGPEMFVALFLDVTDRHKGELALAADTRRKAALAHLGDNLRSATSSSSVAYIAAGIAGPIVDAVQAAYASVDMATEKVSIDSSWSAPGSAALEGSHSLRAYGSYIEELKAGRAVLVSDVRRDTRTRGEVLLALGVVAFINVPVVEHGELVAILLVHFAEPRSLSPEEEDFLRAAADRTRAAIARIRAEERQTILNRELSHRLKNTLAMVQAIANQTLRGATDRNAVSSFERRLIALSTAHEVLLHRNWQHADLTDLLPRVLEAVGVAERLDAAGPPLKLGSRAALSTSLLLHELATNALKYGALTRHDGRIEVRWQFEGEEGAQQVLLHWREIGGPPAVEPTQKGFGSRLLRMGLLGTGGSNICFGPDGLKATFRASRGHVEQA